MSPLEDPRGSVALDLARTLARELNALSRGCPEDERLVEATGVASALAVELDQGVDALIERAGAALEARRADEAVDHLRGLAMPANPVSGSSVDVEEPAIDTAAFQRFVQSTPMAGLTVLGVRRLTGGYSKVTTMVECREADGVAADVVVRQIPRGRSAQSLELEFRLLQALHGRGFPVPEPLWLETKTTEMGGPFMVSRRAAGSSPGTIWGASSLSPEACHSIARIYARLHTLPVPELTLPVSPRRTADDLREMIDWQEATLARRGIGVDRVLGQLLAWLRRHLPQHPWSPVILHGDATLANLMLVDDTVTAVIDWELAHLGDPSEEIAYLRPFVEPFIDWQTFLAEYHAHGGPPVNEEAIAFYTVWADVWRYIGTLWMGQNFHQTGRYAGAVSRYVNGPAYLRSAVRIVHEQTDRDGPQPSA